MYQSYGTKQSGLRKIGNDNESLHHWYRTLLFWVSILKNL